MNKFCIITEEDGCGYASIVGACSSEKIAEKVILGLQHLEGPGNYSYVSVCVDEIVERTKKRLEQELEAYENVLKLLDNLKEP